MVVCRSNSTEEAGLLPTKNINTCVWSISHSGFCLAISCISIICPWNTIWVDALPTISSDTARRY